MQIITSFNLHFTPIVECDTALFKISECRPQAKIIGISSLVLIDILFETAEIDDAGKKIDFFHPLISCRHVEIDFTKKSAAFSPAYLSRFSKFWNVIDLGVESSVQVS